jgi:TPR repeat protein
MQLLVTAAQQYQYPPAQSHVVLVFLQQELVPPEAAIDTLGKLAGRGVAEAQLNLGRILSPYAGIERGQKDPARAIQLLEEALRNDSTCPNVEIGACMELAKLYGAAQNPELRQRVLSRAQELARKLGAELPPFEAEGGGSESGGQAWKWIVGGVAVFVSVGLIVAITWRWRKSRK